MRRHRRRSRPAARAFALAFLRASSSGVSAHPLRATVFALVSLALIWLVLTKSVPYALAPADPELALALNPNNPAALIGRAEKVRAKLLTASGLTGKPPSSTSSETNLTQATMIDQLPKAKGDRVPDRDTEQTILRKEIQSLAHRTILNDPLNADAFRLLAETTTDHHGVLSLMQEVLKRSRRDAIALFWLLNDRYYQKDFEVALSYADLLLRTHPELSAYVFNYVTLIAETPKGASLLVQALSKTPAPAWRGSFFAALPQYMKQSDTPLKLMQALNEKGKPPATKELSSYLDFLIGRNLVDVAYNAWLQFLPREDLDTLGLLTHANFERDPSGLAFDWRIARGLNAVVEFVPPGQQGERALHISFGTGRVQFPEISQVVLLPFGKYHLEGKLRGVITGKRGLRWQLRCIGGSHQVVGETDMLMGRAQDWRIFALEADVPHIDECRGQMLRLFHDSRTASEELINGEVWFASLHLEQHREVNTISE